MRGGLLLAVAQHLADLRQRRALPEHLGRRGVPQPVRPDSAAARPGRTPRARPTPTVHRFMPSRGAVTRKNSARHSHRGRRRRYDTSASPTSTGNGNTILPAALAAHQQQPAPPVDVIEPQPSDLAGTQPQPRQQQQDRVVTPADQRAPIAAGQKLA